ncbi:MAG TPA: tRNA (N(6)-L-threonylcarbamoyladenosine(37)-C(2))-methylthiotransferase MtaB [Terriglobia bacterium]|nr:tRNA (N(6)-L-threonylcarbamoyladenosine(37)-C(2))-methylthiotransferase MtaB [Terriglobia bacterium]
MSARSFFVANFGCRASQSEGAAVEQQLLHGAATRADSAFSADVVVVNTCTVTEEADREARQLIRRIGSRNPNARVLVTGCYAQRAPDELAVLRGVTHVVGNSHKPILGQLALSVLDTDFQAVEPAGRAEIFCSDIFLENELKPESHLGSGGRTRAIVKVQDGCNANCSFCIIPSVRGRSRSLLPASVVEEIEALVDRGYKEVVLSGIHLGTYGRDLEPKTSLYHLIADILGTIPRLERLRLSSIEPLEVTPEIIALVASEPRMARHFHIPLQSGSSQMLRAMRRPYQPAHYKDLLDRIRERIPEAAIGADVMVGFPGETDREFSETFRLIEDAPLTYLHVFPYSARPGTPAAELKERVPAHVASFRAKALRQLIARKHASFVTSMLGRVLDVLVLQPGEGLTANFLRVRTPEDLTSNQWVPLEIAGLLQDVLVARSAEAGITPG